MLWSRMIAVSVLVLTLVVGCGGDEAPTATARPAAQPDPTSSVATATATAIPSPTATPSPTVTPTPSPTPSPTPIPSDPAVYHEIVFNGLDEEDGGNLRLYTVDADGSDLHPLTTAPDGVWEGFPAPSPDGTRIAFLRGFRQAEEGAELPPAEVRVIDLMTNEETLIVTGLGTDFSWSPDSRQLAFTWFEGGSNPCCGGTMGLTSRLVLVNADGSDLRVLSEEERDPVTYAGRMDSQPIWSPDGSHILFQRWLTADEWPWHLAILDLHTSEITELDTGDVRPEYSMAWMHDGRSIAFIGGSGTDLVAPRGVYLLEIDGGAVHRLTDPDLSVANFSLSPDGSQMALAAQSATRPPGMDYTPNHLVVLDITSGQTHDYESGSVFNDLAWSPDGSRIAYLENQDNPAELNLPFLRIIEVATGSVSEPLATIWPTELTRGFPDWRPTVTVPAEPDLGWSDDTLQAVVPGSEYDAAVRPQLDYPWIVWSTVSSVGESDIYALHVETGQIVALPTGQYTNWDVLVEDGVAVWSERACVDCSITLIRGRDLTSGDEFSIDVPPSVTWSPPDFSGRWVVWTEYPAEYSVGQMGVIYARDIQSMSEPVIVAEIPIPFGLHAVSGDLVAVVEPLDSAPVASQIVVRNLATGETVSAIDTLAADHFIYPIDLEGWTLVHVEDGPWPNDDPEVIVITDLKAGTTRTLETYVHQHEGGFPITTDGRFVIFQQDVTAGYDLDRNVWFRLPFLRYYVDLDDGMLVWTTPRHYLNGPTEIHLAPAVDFSSGLRTRYFPESDRWLSLGFLHYWDTNGGLTTFGYPIARHAFGDGGIAEWTERQRLEWHPENAGTVYEIQLGRLGAELLDQQGRDWRSFPPADPTTPHYFAVTGHAIAPEFWDYWSGHGLYLGDRGVSFRESVALFGYPLSEPVVETNADGDTVLTQYFERAVFELHPDNPVEWQVLLRRLGWEALIARGS